MAGNFVEINGPDVIQPQYTTILPDINGMLPLIQLIFAPTIKVLYIVITSSYCMSHTVMHVIIVC